MFQHPGERNKIHLFPSASIILTRLDKGNNDLQIFLGKRKDDLKYFPNSYAGIGGKIEKSDYIFAESIKKSKNLNRSLSDINYLVCAWRELLEEAEIFYYETNNPDLRNQVLSYTRLQKSIDLNDLFSKFSLNARNIRFNDFIKIGFRYTPEFTNIIFTTQFYMLYIDDEKYSPNIRDSHNEFIKGLWIKPEKFFLKFKKNEFQTSPPVLGIIREFYNFPQLLKKNNSILPYNAIEVLNANDDLPIGLQIAIESHPGIQIVPFKSLTRPPATTTNLIVIGDEKKIIIDPGTHLPQERKRLDLFLNKIFSEDSQVLFQLVTHHHQDHWQSATYLRDNYDIPIALNPKINDFLNENEKLPMDIKLADNQILNLGVDKYNKIDWTIRVKFLPGHTSDHLTLIDERFKVLIAGDLIAGVGTVIIEDLEDYFNSLNYLDQEKITTIFPGHGPTVYKGNELIKNYIQHRTLRGEQILATIDSNQGKTVKEITRDVYKDIPNSFLLVAEKQVGVYMKYFENRNQVRFNPNNSKWVQTKDKV